MKIDKVRYIGETVPLELTHGKIYSVLSIERGWYRVVDDTGEVYLYPAGFFEVVKSLTTMQKHRGFFMPVSSGLAAGHFPRTGAGLWMRHTGQGCVDG